MLYSWIADKHCALKKLMMGFFFLHSFFSSGFALERDFSFTFCFCSIFDESIVCLQFIIIFFRTINDLCIDIVRMIRFIGNVKIIFTFEMSNISVYHRGVYIRICIRDTLYTYWLGVGYRISYLFDNERLKVKIQYTMLIFLLSFRRRQCLIVNVLASSVNYFLEKITRKRNKSGKK